MVEFLNNNSIVTISIICALGLGLGSFRIKGISLGTAGILIIALIFGHFQVQVPSIVQNLGLAIFVSAVGFIAGPNFFSIFKGNAIAYVVLGLVIVATGALCCLSIILLFNLKTDLALGLLTGALTSTPGLASALEVTGSDMVSIGYGIAYPFGVISVVLFIQLIPVILHADIEKEREKFVFATSSERKTSNKKLIKCDPRGFFSFFLATGLGILLGKISIPITSKASFSLGTSGGPLLMGILFGHFNSIWKFDLSVKKDALVTIREFGLAMFLIGAGTSAGKGFVEVLQQYGFVLFAYGAIMALIPMILGYFIATKLFKLSMFNTLGSVCGGMTSTPALGALIQLANSDNVASAYAATYPIALACVVIVTQIIGTVF